LADDSCLLHVVGQRFDLCERRQQMLSPQADTAAVLHIVGRDECGDALELKAAHSRCKALIIVFMRVKEV